MKKIVLFLSSLFLLSSCSNIFNSLQDAPKEEKKYKVTVLVQNEAETETINNARNAFPVFKEDSNIDFNIVCYPTAEGKNSANKKVLPYITGSSVEVSLSAGNWSVYCYRFDKTYTETCFESEPVNIVLTEENPSATVKLIEKPVILYDSTVENTLENAVKLPIKVNSSITQVKATWVRSGATCTEILTQENGVYYLKLIPAGAHNPYNGTYNVTFDFYGTGTPRPLLYSVTEVVTVYPYCTTTTWTPAASGLEYFSQESGKWIMNITESCIEKYILTTFYVDPTATTNNENPSGDYFAPFTTLEAAVEAANKYTTLSCTIKIRKGTTCNLASSVTVNGTLTIESYSKNSTDVAATTPAPKILRTGNFTNPMITASSTSGKTLTLNGIDIDGDNKANTSDGGGIYVPTNGKLTLTNTTIQKCKARNGAGIFCAGTIIFDATGKVEIKSNTATSAGSGIYYSNSTTALTLNSTLDTTDEVYFNSGSKYMSLSSNITKNVPVKFFGTNNNTKQVLTNSSTTDYVASSFSKFTVSHSSESWFIDPDGYLTQKQSIMVNSSAPRSGTYGVSTSKEIMQIMQWVNNLSTLNGVTIELQKDIDLSLNSLFKGIGISETKYFGGTFNGNNKEITVNINDSTNATASTGFGFFGYIKNATVKNLVIKGTVKKTGTTPSGYQCYVGGIIGCADNSTITDCRNKVSVEGSTGNYYVGGITGYIKGDSASISRCVNEGDVYSEVSYAGGICGSTNGINTNYKIINCGNSGQIKARQNVGGICAQGGTNIYNCYNIGTLEGTNSSNSRLGGIVGAGLNSAVTIQYCVDYGNYTGSINSKGAITASKGQMNITDCCYYPRESSIKGNGSNDDSIERSYTLSDAVSSLNSKLNALNAALKAQYLEWEMRDYNRSLGLVGL